MTEREDRRDVLITTDGREMKVRPVSQLLLQKVSGAVEQELRTRGVPLDPPTYSVVTAAGDTETHVHDEASLSSTEDRAVWEKYQAARAQLTAEVNARTLKIMLLRGLEAPDPPAEWVEEMQWLGVGLPADPRDLKIEYIQTELLKTPDDIKNCIVRVMQLSMAGMSEEDVQRVEELFRRPVAREEAQ